ncbi:MAG: hypothetical protein M0R80_07050 [Proteobacteria bacterium]|jgi:hypothetical protein|nr:hypothetical protein [Pseudomonadota bacterium]
MEPIDTKKELEKQCGPDCDCAAEGVPAAPASAVPEGDAAQACCGPTCECNAPAPRSKAKIVVAILVLAAAVVVLVVKLAGNAGNPALDEGQSEIKSNAATVVPLAAKPLGSLFELNTSAAALDAVLVVVPAKEGGAAEQEIAREVDAARQKLVAKAMTVGVYSLRTDTPEYGALAGRHKLPGVVVFAGGGEKALVSAANIDAGMLTGTITESKLLQAYVAASMGASGGGCNCAKGASCGGN